MEPSMLTTVATSIWDKGVNPASAEGEIFEDEDEDDEDGSNSGPDMDEVDIMMVCKPTNTNTHGARSD